MWAFYAGATWLGMPGLIKILRWYFGIEALLLLISPVFAVWNQPPAVLHSHAMSVDQQVRIALALASFGAVLLILAAVFGMAWWTLAQAKPSSRIWAIAASLLNVPLVFVARPMWLSTAAGIAGLWFFSRRQAFTWTVPNIPRPERDGTNGIVDTAAQLAMCAGALAIWSWWSVWAQSRDLPMVDGLPLILQLIFASLVCTTFHELGHVMAGWSVGMKVHAFVAGPFHWRVRDGRWTFEFHLTGLLLSTGAAGLVPSRGQYRCRSGIAVAAAGPMASLVLGTAALIAALNAEGHPWNSAWEFLALISTCSLLTFAINLIPIRPEGSYSDGARIYQLLFRGS